MMEAFSLTAESRENRVYAEKKNVSAKPLFTHVLCGETLIASKYKAAAPRIPLFCKEDISIINRFAVFVNTQVLIRLHIAFSKNG